ncbi:LD-carboxypeptidase [Clostridium botulinum]|uniref:Peptidase S66 n=1 Tax=Clostridium botulinum C/D str. DC5 TaxID=1443128 RepID=A0A0A0IAB8_CLOBO|nr:LD-carboxypeptidase [Clostridium botulinum]KEI06736.1 peptidase S66 [Clostridium botulinum C/D str. BKT75002]KEI10846.1 peptidase S66 [Clostridium botulinum C/D str. BKT2873]KGM94774.1 peptidase S66 [Clostridium botulinum D str. CCUG 7971]KGM97867.1 peptidase S66 [Clostridium botulinum C/D str. DC5]KOC49234.1 peptidase S66 [Clostridium botulinum]
MIANRLKLGDTIGLVSPAGPADPKKIKEAINFFESNGFRIKEGNHIYDKCGYLAGTDADRAKDLMDMFLDKDVSMILCIRGGYGAMRILPLLDYDIIKKNPKLFIGFSDITVLLNTINSYCGLITFHGPMATSNFANFDTCQSFFSTLMNGTRPYNLMNPPNVPLSCNVCGIAEGKIVGGNLSLICATMGTPYEIDTKDNILFIEDVHEAPYAIDRDLTQLALAGKLDKCSGIILGQFTDCTLPNYEGSFTLEEVINDRILSLNKPTLCNFMSGHDYPKLTLPIGARAMINCNKNELYIIEPVVK